MALNDPLPITLKFGSSKLPMVVERADEIIYRDAERLINSRFSYYTSKYPTQSREMWLLMTALDIAVRLKRAEAEGDSAPMREALGNLLEEVEKSLA